MRTCIRGPRQIRSARVPVHAYRLRSGDLLWRPDSSLWACRRSQNVRAQGAVRLEAEFSMETEPVVRYVRDAHAVPRGPGHSQGDERHRGADPLLAEFRDHGHVDARDAGAEE